MRVVGAGRAIESPVSEFPAPVAGQAGRSCRRVGDEDLVKDRRDGKGSVETGDSPLRGPSPGPGAVEDRVARQVHELLADTRFGVAVGRSLGGFVRELVAQSARPRIEPAEAHPLFVIPSAQARVLEGHVDPARKACAPVLAPPPEASGLVRHVVAGAHRETVHIGALARRPRGAGRLGARPGSSRHDQEFGGEFRRCRDNGLGSGRPHLGIAFPIERNAFLGFSRDLASRSAGGQADHQEDDGELERQADVHDVDLLEGRRAIVYVPEAAC